jgi:gliding motility-associated-like protein
MPSVIITINPLPNADFSFSNNGLLVNFLNSSSGEVSWAWDFGSGAFSNNENPSFNFFQQGEFEISLEVENEFGCIDSITKLIQIEIPISFPNIITPNGDNINDYFQVETSAVKKYAIVILNRWGNEVFSSTDKNNHWNGKDKNGFVVDDGVYFYKIQLETLSSSQEVSGSVTVFK